MKQELIIDDTIYSLNSLMKSAYRFTDSCYFYFKRNENNDIVIEFTPKEGYFFEQIANEFKNVLLHEKIRENVFKDTKNIREILLSRAIYGLTLEDSNIIEEKSTEKIDFSKIKSKDSYKDDSYIGKSRY